MQIDSRGREGTPSNEEPGGLYAVLRCLVEIAEEAEADYRPEDDEEVSMIFLLGSLEQAAAQRELRVLVLYDELMSMEARWSRRFLLPGSWNHPRPWARTETGGIHTPTGVRIYPELRERRDLPKWLAEQKVWPNPQLIWLEGERVGSIWETWKRVDPSSALITPRPLLDECRRVARILSKCYTPGLGYRTDQPLYRGQ